MSRSSNDKLIEQLRRVLKDAIDYFQSVITLLQARLAEMALSSVVFLVLLGFAGLLGLASFLMFNIALGVWLSYVLGGPGYSILMLGSIYGLLAYICGVVALRWLKQLKS